MGKRHRERWFAGRAPCAKCHAEFRDHKTTALKNGICAYERRWHLYRCMCIGHGSTGHWFAPQVALFLVRIPVLIPTRWREMARDGPSLRAAEELASSVGCCQWRSMWATPAGWVIWAILPITQTELTSQGVRCAARFQARQSAPCAFNCAGIILLMGLWAHKLLNISRTWHVCIVNVEHTKFVAQLILFAPFQTWAASQSPGLVF